MGDVRFVDGSFRFPQTARTGEEITCSAEVDNTNAFDWEYFKIVWSVYSDSEGENLVAQGSKEDRLWGWPGVKGGYTSKALFDMPAFDVWVMIELYRRHDGRETKSDSTGLVEIDNPATPDGEGKVPWWKEEVMGVPVYGYVAVGSFAVAGAVVSR